MLCWGYDQYGQVDGAPNATSPYYSSGSPPGGGTFTQVSAGGNHTCGIRTSGTMLCWGDDQYGQVDGVPGSYSSGSPPGGGTFTEVSAGETHTCGIRTSGTILCWGDDQYGQVDGVPNSTSPHYSAGSPPGGGTFSQVTSGGNHTCGLRTDGTIFCWGYDADGEVDGNPNLVSPFYSSGSPPAAGSFTQITAGYNYTCGIKTDGSVLCWGNDFNGQVDGSPVQTGTSYSLGSPPGGGTFSEIGAGDYHTCGIKTNGTSFCWGFDGFGETNGSPAAKIPLYGKGSAPGGGTFLQISAGGYHTCGIKSNGTTFCWGDDEYGQANGTPLASYPFYGQGGPPGGGTYTQASVSAGGSHTCALSVAGAVTCTGDDTYGQLNGTASKSTHTVTKPGPYIQVSAGQDHTCALTPSHIVYCWGGATTAEKAAPPGGTFLTVTSGGAHSCGLRPNRSVVCWGDEQVVAAGPFLEVSAGLNHSCGVLANDNVKCWGSNASGQAPSLTVGPFVQVSAGDTNSCAVAVNSTVQCWGDDSSLQSDPPFDTFNSVSAGASHVCGVRTNGNAICWGLNSSGQSDAPAGTFLSVSAGGTQSCGVESNGSTVLCWGAASTFNPSRAPAFSNRRVTRSGGSTTVTWKGIKSAIGYNVYSQGSKLNDPLRTSKTQSYTFSVKGNIQHISLSPVERL